MYTLKFVFVTACACSLLMVGCARQKSAPKNGQTPGDTSMQQDTTMKQDTMMHDTMGQGSSDTGSMSKLRKK